MEEKNTERGAASIFIELKDGNITVKHGTSKWAVLKEVKDAEVGSWDKIWEALDSLKSVS